LTTAKQRADQEENRLNTLRQETDDKVAQLNDINRQLGQPSVALPPAAPAPLASQAGTASSGDEAQLAATRQQIDQEQSRLAALQQQVREGQTQLADIQRQIQDGQTRLQEISRQGDDATRQQTVSLTTRSVASQARDGVVEVKGNVAMRDRYTEANRLYQQADAANAAHSYQEATDTYQQAIAMFNNIRQETAGRRETAREALDRANERSANRDRIVENVESAEQVVGRE
jgi:TolA-binding protein